MRIRGGKTCKKQKKRKELTHKKGLFPLCIKSIYKSVFQRWISKEKNRPNIYAGNSLRYMKDKYRNSLVVM